MQKKNPTPSNQERSVRRSGSKTRTGAILLIALSFFYFLVCTPVYLISVTNVLIKESIFPQIWDLFLNLLLFLNYWILSAWLVVICFKEGFSKIWPLCGWYVLASLIRFFGSVSISTRILQSNDLKEDYLNALQDCLLEWIPLAIIIGIIWIVWKSRYRDLLKDMRPQKLFPLNNPMVTLLFWLAAVPSFLHLLNRIPYDIFIGAPKQKTDLIGMIVFYIADLLSWLIGYFVIFFFVNRLTRPEKVRDKSP